MSRTPPVRKAALRVLLVEPTLADTGALRVTLDRAARWHAAGAVVDLLVLQHGDDEHAVPAGVRLHRATPAPARLRQTVGPALRAAHRLARRSDVVVSGREIGDGLLIAAVASRTSRRPLAVTVQSRPDRALKEYVDPKLRTLNRRAIAGAGMGVCVAQDIVPHVIAMGLPSCRACVVTNGVPVQQVRADALAEPTTPLPAGRLVVGSGRLEHQKGFDLLIRAHARALAAGAPDHSLVLLGEGKDRPALQSLAQELGVADSVVLAGFVTNPSAIVARADLFVLPSRWEGFPLALVEAVCLGVPSLAAACVSGPREVLQDGAFGRLIPPEDETVLADALVEHLRDPQDLRERAKRGASQAAERFDPDTAAARHLAMLTVLADGR